MREILGKRRTNGDGDDGDGDGDRGDRRPRQEALGDEAVREAALRCARRWGWPVVPGMEVRADGRCRCTQGPDCVVPGAHPADPALLAATTDARMVGWWWRVRPRAPILMATGGLAPCALSLPAAAGAWALTELDRAGTATGPVVATATRYALLVRPYELPELGELLSVRGGVPSSLRFHGPGGYLPMPPSATGTGRVRWVRPPRRRRGQLALPHAAGLLDLLVEAGISAPDQGSRLAY